MKKTCLRYLWALLVLAPLAQSAEAGAWLEGEGQGFIATATRMRQNSAEVSAYAAYGLGPALTLGLDLNRSHGTGPNAGQDSARALLFARLPLRQGDGEWKLATELSFGMVRSAQDWGTMHRLTLSAGRGWSLGQHSGWIALDLGRERLATFGQAAWKLDATLGLNPRGTRPAPLMQVEFYQSDQADLQWKLLPALRWPLPEGRDLITGLELRSTDQSRLGLRLELWQRF